MITLVMLLVTQTAPLPPDAPAAESAEGSAPRISARFDVARMGALRGQWIAVRLHDGTIIRGELLSVTANEIILVVHRERVTLTPDEVEAFRALATNAPATKPPTPPSKDWRPPRRAEPFRPAYEEERERRDVSGWTVATIAIGAAVGGAGGCLAGGLIGCSIASAAPTIGVALCLPIAFGGSVVGASVGAGFGGADLPDAGSFAIVLGAAGAGALGGALAGAGVAATMNPSAALSNSFAALVVGSVVGSSVGGALVGGGAAFGVMAFKNNEAANVERRSW